MNSKLNIDIKKLRENLGYLASNKKIKQQMRDDQLMHSHLANPVFMTLMPPPFLQGSLRRPKVPSLKLQDLNWSPL